MPQAAERRSPVHDLLSCRSPQWGRAAGAPIALRFGDGEAEAARELALCDLSALPKLGLKGPGAESWLRRHQVEIPPATYDVARLADGGLIARLGGADFFLEGGPSDEVLPRLAAVAADVYRVERQDATFLLSGARSLKVLARLSSIDFATASPRRLILTRAGGVNCGVLPDPDGVPAYRLWVDFTYAASFWESAVEVVEGLGGRVVGAACFYPELAGGRPRTAETNAPKSLP
jgi:sarcosine oxidase subunit gamma